MTCCAGLHCGSSTSLANAPFSPTPILLGWCYLGQNWGPVFSSRWYTCVYHQHQFSCIGQRYCSLFWTSGILVEVQNYIYSLWLLARNIPAFGLEVEDSSWGHCIEGTNWGEVEIKEKEVTRGIVLPYQHPPFLPSSSHPERSGGPS